MANERRVIDIVFATTSGIGSFGDFPPPTKKQVQLSETIFLGRQPNELWDAVYAACKPRGYAFNPTPQFGQRYAFWNTGPTQPDGYNWDPDQSLATAVALSRLVHPSSIGFEYSARVTCRSDNQIDLIVPGPVSGLLAHAYVVPVDYDWLGDDDASQVSRLFASFAEISSNLPTRVKRAFWNCEYAAALEWVDVRWTVVATGLESLVHTDRYQSTRQFVQRVTGLADRLSVDFTEDDAERAYDLRSSGVHGRGFESLDDSTLALYYKMETVLRSSIPRAIEDAAFRDIFLGEDRIRAEFPLKGTRKRPE